MKPTEKSLLFVYNPVSGKGQITDALGEIIVHFTRLGFRVTVHPTSKSGDGSEYIAANGTRYDVIAVGGGDGMLNEAVGALLKLPKDARPPLAYLPAGSTNDFAATVGLPLDPLLAAKSLEGAGKRQIDAGTLNDSGFAYIAAFGAFTDVAYDTPQDFKNVFGHLAYILQGLASLPSIREHHVRVTHGGSVTEGDYIYGMVSNTRQVGGMRLADDKTVSLCDGLFEVLLIKPPKTPAELQTLLGALVGKTFNSECITAFMTNDVVFESDEPLPWTLDGEYGGETTVAHIVNHPLAYTLLLPRA